MANEATLLVRTAHPIQFTVSDATGIEKGTVLTLSDPNTAAATVAAGAMVAGIAASEKIASDGNTKLGVYREGIFKLTASGAIAVGKFVQTASGSGKDNKIMAHTGAFVSGGTVLGQALETAASGETLRVHVRIM